MFQLLREKVVLIVFKKFMYFCMYQIKFDIPIKGLDKNPEIVSLIDSISIPLSASSSLGRNQCSYW
jgi:hypothetical protein